MQQNINLQAFKGSKDKVNEIEIQFIPAKMEITSSGKAPVAAFFDQYTEEVDGELTNSLRGYPLQGRKFKIPDGLLGIVYEENQPKSETNRILKVNTIFSKYTYWNYDKVPSKNDSLIKALDWIDISKSFQQPADPNELVLFIENQNMNCKPE